MKKKTDTRYINIYSVRTFFSEFTNMDSSTTTTTINCNKIYIFGKRKISIQVNTIREELSVTDLKLQNEKLYTLCHKLSSPQKKESIDAVILLAHPCDDETGDLDTSKRIAVICIGIEYTIYKLDNEHGDVSMKIAKGDEFDLKTGKFKEYKFIKKQFFSETEANQEINSNPGENYYNNRHDILTETNYRFNAHFRCYNCARFTDEYCTSCDFKYVCVDCHKHVDDVKRVRSIYLRLAEIPAIKKNSWCGRNETKMVFCKEQLIDLEIITAIQPEDLPWVNPVIEEFPVSLGHLKGYSIKVS